LKNGDPSGPDPLSHVAPRAVLGALRRVAKHRQGGDKCLAAIHLAQMGLPGIGEDAAYRLALAAELVEAGVTPRELARELGLSPIQLDVSKYDEVQPRVPAGSGRESGQLECHEEMGTTIGNSRGDVAVENLRVCFGLGAFVDYSITLHTRESEKGMKLVEYDPSSDATAPVTLRWIDNDTLSVDLGNVRSVWSKVDKVGSIHIIYSHTNGKTRVW
jgi:hypothetical protein